MAAALISQCSDIEGEFAGECTECGANLGKRHLNPRHHCHVCKNAVCSTCSPSLLKLSGEEIPQRVCNPCAGNVQVALALKQQLTVLEGRLHKVGQVRADSIIPKAHSETDASTNGSTSDEELSCNSSDSSRSILYETDGQRISPAPVV